MGNILYFINCKKKKPFYNQIDILTKNKLSEKAIRQIKKKGKYKKEKKRI
jgi:hypothetical protein